ncbi:sigma-70 family RNA polymerase sigma factor [Candidatus Poribacteria bacterium]|jgi:RNA polymerase sigma factor (sigma-70 family)|nr:sigma-70 family RNA polymerase sigma factor [Candidatus Poribacteria bacterium]MBT5534214.1 sigma-70 family RNA polymerase sigma factor [Candidatus Poribacteria bacterium]MBT5710718.1 sigma-70 family RNA polymerase sigma factor [Candidatus Poribacteria bacterium]MBT7095898.1 sigma-70 family RNA polymerase sigma factor [Candidatus Poribacteria bacterium]MBT7808199.1 sigma-70 family RNA polymerase sigma factor [Candidatus Poribacteria bacterium]
MAGTDAELVRHAIAGDVHAFGELTKRYQEAVYALAVSHTRDFTEAEDIAQDAFLSAYERLATLRDAGRFGAWVRGIASNMCRDWQRKAYRRRETPTAWTHHEAQHAGRAPDAGLRAGEDRDALLKALRVLNQVARQTLLLHYLAEFSQRDIAAFLGTSVTAVETRLHRARKRLREEIGTMAEDTLRDSRLGDEFTNRLAAELLAKPRPLEQDGHPIADTWQAIRQALPEFEVVAPRGEIEPRTLNADVLGAAAAAEAEAIDVDTNTVLRSHLTPSLLDALRGRAAPCRVIAAGRVFRDDTPGPRRSQVFHQVEAAWLASDVTEERFRECVEAMLRTVTGAPELRWQAGEFGFTDPGWEVEAKFNAEWVELMGVGRMKDDVVAGLGFEPDEVSLYGFGLGIERIAMLVRGIDDIHDLWR